MGALDEAALRRPLGDQKIQRGQLLHLIEMAQRPNIILQIVPFDAGGHAAAGGPFTILRSSSPDLPDVVYLEHLTNAIRAVRYLASEAGIRQFLDIGTGLPTMQNTHEVAQQVAPESKIVYVDNDPLVLVHARALLRNTTPEGVTAYLDADFNDPDMIIADARNVLNFNQPIGVMFMGVLGHVAEFDDARSIVGRVMGAVPSGSYLVLWDGNDTNQAYVDLCEAYTKTGGVPYIPRSNEQIG